MSFKNKALAALLASAAGALGAHRLYLGKPRWWLPLGITLLMVPLLVGVRNWFQTPPFFIVMVPVVAGFVEALVLALTPDDKFDARYNPGSERKNQSGWGAVLVAGVTLLVGAALMMATLVLMFQTYFEYTMNVPK